jgi:hypothetical protein
MKKLALLCAILLSGCAQIVAHQEELLADAGFRSLPADTPERQAMLASLPAYNLVRGMDGSLVNYTFADPGHCNCLYVGTALDYANYRRRMGDPSRGAFAGGLRPYNPPPPAAMQPEPHFMR